MKKFLRSSILILMLGVLVLHTPTYANLNESEMLPPPVTPDAEIPPAQSTTGPQPPLEVQLRDLLNAPAESYDIQSQVVLSVPAYLWRHGCGPTALSMVVGYYDGKGFSDLIAGDPWSQTTAVNQMIASGGGGYDGSGAPFPAGSEGHFEDYSLPIDPGPSVYTDAYITAGRATHPDNSLADYLGTSFSEKRNPYGWSWSTEMDSAFVDYFHSAYPGAGVSSGVYYPMNWDVLVREINAGRPMVFLVDSNGDGGTDHFVTVIGYRDSPQRQYASHDTWDTEVRWSNFAPMAAGVLWGIFEGWSYQVAHPPTDIALSKNQVAEYLPIGSEIGSFSTSDVLIGDLFSYTLVAGSGDGDNAAFSISGNRLLSNVVFNFDSRTDYSIRVRSTDSNGDFTEKSFAIRVVDVDVKWVFLPVVMK